ncbi:MAG: hypothetical protein OEY66_01505 [Gammaproteobacteria bacterium]|nr:hypothetical protein [Gammaproteobacteria bacterium]
MSNEIKKNTDRMLVSLNFDGDGSSLIESLVKLASQLNAELCGLFTEDSDLQQIANLPFSREITFPTAHTRNLNSEQIARHLKQHAETLRKIIQDFSQLANVACSFRTAKGSRIETALSESYNFQIVVILPEKYSSLKPGQHARLDDLINPAVMLYDGSKQAQKSAYIVKLLAGKGDLHELKVLALNNDCEALIKQQLSIDNIKVDCQHIDSYNILNIVSLIGKQKTGLVILPLEDALIKQSKEIREMLNTLKCPLLLVR